MRSATDSVLVAEETWHASALLTGICAQFADEQHIAAQSSPNPLADLVASPRPAMAKQNGPLAPERPGIERPSEKSPAERPSPEGPAMSADQKVSMVTASVVIEPPAAQMDSAGPSRAAASAIPTREAGGDQVTSSASLFGLHLAILWMSHETSLAQKPTKSHGAPHISVQPCIWSLGHLPYVPMSASCTDWLPYYWVT